MDVGVGVLIKQVNMGIQRRVDLVLHIASPPGSICTRSINESNRKLIEVIQSAGDRFTGARCYRDFGFRVFGIQHLLFELKALVTRCNPGKITGRRVTGLPASNRILAAGQHRGSTSAIRAALNALVAN